MWEVGCFDVWVVSYLQLYIIMNSFIQANEQTIVDFNTIIPKLRQVNKSFTFFIYYLKTQLHPNSTNLQKIAFKLKEQKSKSNEKQQHGRLVQLFFIDLQNQHEIEQSFLDIRTQLLQSLRLKLIFYSYESYLLQILERAHSYGIDVSNLPAALYSPSFHSDLSQHLGWRQSQLGDLSLKASFQFEQNVRKWIRSPGEKIDMWSAIIHVEPQDGKILVLDRQTNIFQPIPQKVLKELFLSHMSIGHHAELVANYQKNKKEENQSFRNKFIFKFESLKKFCCIGKPSLENSTGIVSIVYRDEKGHEIQITKELKKGQEKKGILSLVFSNIERFQGIKLSGCRLSDSKIQMGVFQSSSDWRLISSINGQIQINLHCDEIFLQINSSCLKLLKPTKINLKLERKVKVLISQDTLQC